MKILFIKPYWRYPYSKSEHTYNRIWPPLSLANCAAIIENEGCDAEILDCHALRIKPHKLSKYIVGFDKIFITSSSIDRWQCPNIEIQPFFDTVESIRQINQEVYVMGYHGTENPEEILTKTSVKAVIRGEPEEIVAKICRGDDLTEIAGVSFRNEEQFIHNPDHEDVNLQKLPVPAFHLLKDINYNYEILGDNFWLFEVGRGCNFICNFCNKIMYGKKLRKKSIDQVKEEISVAVEQFHVKSGYFIDLEFLSYKNLVVELCEFLISKNYNFRWCCQTRADSLDAKVLRIMKKAGCELIHVGVEGGLQKYLDLTNKNIKENKIINGVQMCHQAGINTLAFFMFGLRNETDIDRKAIYRFAKKLNTTYASFHRIYPYVKGDFYELDAKVHKKIDRFIRMAFIKYYLRLDYLTKLTPMALLRSLRLYLDRLISLS